MRVIPAHAGSTHSNPRNPANAATLAAATDAIGHPVEQPSVSDRARAEGLDPGGGENGAIKKSRASVQGAAQSPLQPPVNQVTKNLKYRIWITATCPRAIC